jgi:hypothetical protein
MDCWSYFIHISKQSNTLQNYCATEVVSEDFKAWMSIGLGLPVEKDNATDLPLCISTPEQEVTFVFLK